MKLIIGNKNYSSWSLRPWLLLKHFDIPFEEVRIPLFTDGFEVTLAQYTDAGKVPVLHDAGLVVWDSLAICEYISEQYLDGQGWPNDPTPRAEARSASAEMHSSFTRIREHMPMNCRARHEIDFSTEVSSEIKRVDALWQSLREKYRSRGDWLCGGFSIADCMYAPMASRFHSYRPALSTSSQAYVQSLIDHPQMQLWYSQATSEKEVIPPYEVGAEISIS
mgnify:CR=1 FL=1